MPGRASSSEESCDPPSSAGIEHAAPALKVAASYNPPSGASRILAPGAGPQGFSEGGGWRPAGDDELGMGKQLAQDGTGARIERHLEVEIELGLGAARAQARQHEPPALVRHPLDSARAPAPLARGGTARLGAGDPVVPDVRSPRLLHRARRCRAAPRFDDGPASARQPQVIATGSLQGGLIASGW